MRQFFIFLTSLIVALGIWLAQTGGQQNVSHAVVDTKTAEPPVLPEGDRWKNEDTLAVRTTPSSQAPIMAWIGANEPFVAMRFVEGDGCPEPGWAKVQGDGFVCLKDSMKTGEAPVRLPRLVRFVHPDPREWNTYLQSMRFDTDPHDRIDAMVPFIYAKRWRRWRGTRYASVDAFESGQSPMQRLGSGRKYHFVDVVPTAKGTALLQADGSVVPAEDIHIYPLSKFHGWSMNAEPLAKGFLPAWAIDYEGTPVHTKPSHHAPVGVVLPYHSAIVVEDTPVDQAGQWWMMPNGLGPGRAGYVNDQTGIRHWVPSAELPDVRPGELWLDVDLGQQVLAVRRGARVEFVTLISSGAPDTRTPRGIYSIKDKAIWSDMASRPGSDDPYYVEKVPWVMHFKKRYSLHGTFWHWGFGHAASHGCINLSVRDARWIFDRITPTAWGGWSSVRATTTDPGTTLRIRRGQAAVPDRRALTRR